MPYHEDLFVSQESINAAEQALLDAREADCLAEFEKITQNALEAAYRYMVVPEFRAFVSRMAQQTLDRMDVFRADEKRAA